MINNKKNQDDISIFLFFFLKKISSAQYLKRKTIFQINDKIN